MDRLERAFRDTERVADATLKAATDLAKLAKQLQKAAKEGNITSIKRTQDRLNAQLGGLGKEVANAAGSWPFEDEEEEQYLKEGYASELRHAASEQGLEIHERDGRLISHPSIVRVLPGDRSVKIDRKKISTIRPSHLVGILIENQKKPAKYRSMPFLQALYRVYQELVTDESPDRLMKGGAGRVVRLDRVYKLFTSLPGSSRDYTPTDFARDIYLLETSGPAEPKAGVTASFPASTGTRGTRGVFAFIGPDGREVQYYSVRFTEEG